MAVSAEIARGPGDTLAEQTKEPAQAKGTFYISVHTEPNHAFAGFVIIQSETMYAAWLEALRTLGLTKSEYILVCPFNHLPDDMKEWTKTATPRQVIL